MRRAVILIVMVILFSTSCSVFPRGQLDERQTTEVEFEHIQVKRFEENRLTFEGTWEGETSVYTYDMNEKILMRQQNAAVDWEEKSDRIHYLGVHGIVSLQSSEGFDRLVLTDKDTNEKQLVQVPAEQSLQLCVAPNREYLLYWTESSSEGGVYLYDVKRDEHVLVAELPNLLNNNDVLWAGNSKYFMLKERHVYRVPDGKEVLEVDGTQARWSPVSDELLVMERNAEAVRLPDGVEKNYGHRVVKYDVLTNEKQLLFYTEAEQIESPSLILDDFVWDEQGRYFAFATGRVNGEQVYYEQVHVMDPQGGLHYVENEQNLRPSSIEDITFSPNNDFFSYTANGLLKVMYIPAQRSKVFDVYTQMKNDESDYLIFNENEAWVLGSYEIRRLSGGLEEKSVYRSSDEIMRFFVAKDGESLLVIERESDNYQLKLVSLLELESDAEAN